MALTVRPCRQTDIASVCEIYNHYVRHTTITFEEEPVPEAAMRARVAECQGRHAWLVCEDEEQGGIVGYAYASPWKARAAYRHTAEVTVYLRHGLGRRGYGGALYASLLEQLAQQGCHAAVACIALPNEASVALHERMGFRPVARFNEVGRKFDRWLDVGYWQLMLADRPGG